MDPKRELLRHTVATVAYRGGKAVRGASPAFAEFKAHESARTPARILAHIGDPMHDIGWLCVKTWRFGGPLPVGGFGHRDELFRAYDQAGGGPVDSKHVRFWEAFGCVKWALMCMHRGLGAARGARGGVEAVAIGRRIEEPLLDLLDLITGKGD